MSVNSIVYKITIDDVRYGSDFLPYTNLSFGISSGTFVLDTRGDLLSGLDNHKSSINSSNGGNLSGSYTFGFNIINEDFANTILLDGVFFKNLLCTLEISTDGGSVFNKDWVGIVDNITVTDLEVKFKCIERTKQLINSIGSDEIPICFGKNYNNKIIENERTITKYILQDDEYYYQDVVNIIGNTFRAFITNNSIDEGYLLKALNDGKDLFIEVVAGAGAGTLHRIKSYSIEGSGSFVIVIYTIEDTSVLSDANEDKSIYRVVELNYTYKLSQNEVSIHKAFNNLYEKTLTLYLEENKIETKQYKTSYITSYEEYNEANFYGVKVKNLNDNGEIDVKTSISIANSINLFTFWEFYGQNYFSANINLDVNSTQQAFKDIGDNKFYLDLGKITLANAYSVISSDSLDCVTCSIKFYSNIKNVITLKKTIEFINKVSSNPNISIERSGLDLIIDFTNYSKDFLQFESIDTLKYMEEYLKDALIQVQIYYLDPSGDIFTPSNISIENISFVFEDIVKPKNISIGAYGEDITLYNQTNTVYVPIKYLLTNQMGVDIGDINEVSFTSCEDDYNNYPVVYEKNPAHQITSQVDAIEILKSILNEYHISLFIARDGRYTLKNWLWQSYILNQNLIAPIAFSELNTISIGDIKRDNINNISSDIELKFNLKEYKDIYDNIIRIKGTNDSVFDFDKHTEGIEYSDYATAESAWRLLRSGYKRIKSQSQTKSESKWYKTRYSNDTGFNEAINALRNRLVHTTREHEYIEIVTSFQFIDVDLLSFVSISDPKITDSIVRNGWVVERVVDNKKFLIKLKILLDVSIYDPFIDVISVINDNSLLGDTYIDNSLLGDTIQDGDGIT